MTYKELVKEVSKKTNFTQKDITVVTKAMFNIIEDTVVSGENVVIKGFGSFHKKKYYERTTICPSTKEKIFIPEISTVKFYPGIDFRRKVRE